MVKKILHRILDTLRGEQNLEKLNRRGLKVGARFKRMGGVIIDPSHCWLIEMGDDVTLAPRVHILAHDASTKTHLNYTKIGTVKIGNRVFIGAGTIVLPGVEIGDDVVIGAGSVISHSIPANSVVVGCPAKVVCTLDDYLAKEKAMMKDSNVFDKSFTVPYITEEKKEMQFKICNQYGRGFVE